VNLSVDQAQAAIDGHADRLSVAVSNSPQSSVLSGDPIALAAVLETLRSQNIFCRAVQVDVAAHSPHMDALRGELEAALHALQPHASTIPIYSTVTGCLIAGEALDATYWSRNLREPVMFSTATQQLLSDGVTTFIELSPHPILLAAIEQGLQDRQQAGLTLPSLRRDDDEQAVMLASLGALYAQGYDVSWSKLYPQGSVVSLPAYPWQHERFWFQSSTIEGGSATQRSRGVKQDHPLLGWQLDLADRSGGFVWEVELSPSTLPHLYDHRLNGTALLAASTYVEIALAAGRAAFGDQLFILDEVSFKRALLLSDERTLLQVALSPAASGVTALTVHSRQADAWVLHFSATLRADANQVMTPVDPLDAIRARCDREMSRPDVYRYLDAKGVQIGDTLQGIANIWRGNNELLARLTVPTANGNYLIAPAVLDSLFQLLGFVVDDKDILMPVQAEVLRSFLTQRTDSERWGYAHLSATEPDSPVVDVCLLDEAGHRIAEIVGLRLKRFGGERDVSDNVDDWVYEVQWVPSPKLESARDNVKQQASHGWLIFADRGGVSEALASALAKQGEYSVLISVGDTCERLSEMHFRIRPDRADDVRMVFEQIKNSRGVVYLAGLDVPEATSAASLEAGQASSCGPVLHIVHELTRCEWSVPPLVWLITRNAQMADQLANIAQSPLWGLGRVIAEEHRDHWGGLIDLDLASNPDEAAACIVTEILHSDSEDQLAYRGGQRYVARLARFHGQRSTLGREQLRPDAAYLVTGGLGGIGQKVARWLAQQGARRLILMGRTPLPPRAEWDQIQDARQIRMAHAVRELEVLGVSVHYTAVDVAAEDQLRSFFDQYRLEGWPPIRGIIHAAGVIDDQMLTQLDAVSLRAVMRPKAIGGWLLHRLFEDQPLDFFVLFSSVGSLMGQVGQGSYAAANAFLDALAHYRRACDLPALSINWGAWSGLGFAATAGGQRVIKHLATQGVAGFSAKQGLEALARLLPSEAAQAVVLPIDWARLRESRATTSRLLIDLIEEVSDQMQTSVPEKSLRDTLCELAPAQRRSALEGYLQSTLAQVLRMVPARIEPDMPFGRLGLESLMAVEFRNRLAVSLNLSLSATLAWNYPTITELATYLASKLDLALEPIGSSEPIEPAPMTPEVDQAAAKIEEMSDDEALQALRSRRKEKR
jgi:myxalamid-type polyketide synthase MxaE and MxaD